MEYIDKTKNSQAAHKLLQRFLEEINNGPIDAEEDLYECLTRCTDIWHKFRQLILDDTNGKCCYCMRKISGVTLEHVIIRSAENEVVLKKYFETQSELDKDNIILESTFLKEKLAAPPFPHTIAYENLIPSCIGNLPKNGQGICCNFRRGDNYVPPMVFRKTIQDEIIYYTDGGIDWNVDCNYDEEGVLYVSKLGLDCIELQVIRYIWYFLSDKEYDLSSANRKEIIYSLLGQENSSNEFDEMLMNFENDSYWNLLEKYSYFNDVKKFTAK